MIWIDLGDMQVSGSAVTGCVIGVVLVGREVAWIGVGGENTQVISGMPDEVVDGRSDTGGSWWLREWREVNVEVRVSRRLSGEGIWE